MKNPPLKTSEKFIAETMQTLPQRDQLSFVSSMHFHKKELITSLNGEYKSLCLQSAPSKGSSFSTRTAVLTAWRDKLVIRFCHHKTKFSGHKRVNNFLRHWFC